MNDDSSSFPSSVHRSNPLAVDHLQPLPTLASHAARTRVFVESQRSAFCSATSFIIHRHDWWDVGCGVCIIMLIAGLAVHVPHVQRKLKLRLQLLPRYILLRLLHCQVIHRSYHTLFSLTLLHLSFHHVFHVFRYFLFFFGGGGFLSGYACRACWHSLGTY